VKRLALNPVADNLRLVFNKAHQRVAKPTGVEERELLGADAVIYQAQIAAAGRRVLRRNGVGSSCVIVSNLDRAHRVNVQVCWR
jgi:hypothetical protein